MGTARMRRIPTPGHVPQRKLAMDEATFLALTFDAALALAERAAVDYQEDYASAAGQEVHVWYANQLVVRYGADHRPLSVQLCGTQARLEPLDDAPPRPARSGRGASARGTHSWP
jgi:hypothetical protein